MRKRFFSLGLMIAVAIGGATWAHQSTSKLATRAETVDMGTTWSSSEHQLAGVGGSKRLLGLCLLAMTGTTVVLRARRPRTI
jgi:hypothetical protein